ncbi:hypothetical protein NA78x_003432 [Anatilimnocola sp. NA78]|uniref:hypothetical protein n=1 Tax=Anatilimnocola sp. NA78 TaxID=3415683 RepID=UPI003CE49577
MIHRFVGALLVLSVSTLAIAGDPISFPSDVPPVIGMAVVSEPGTGDESREWKIKLTVPKIAWEVVGEVTPKKRWPELKSEVEKAILTLRMGGPSPLTPSRVVDLKGMELSRDQVVKRLEKEIPVLVSVSGRMPDAYFLQLTAPDSLVVILGARDNYPAPELLPAIKTATTKSDKGGDK